jgi:hypothetical protein
VIVRAKFSIFGISGLLAAANRNINKTTPEGCGFYFIGLSAIWDQAEMRLSEK